MDFFNLTNFFIMENLVDTAVDTLWLMQETNILVFHNNGCG